MDYQQLMTRDIDASIPQFWKTMDIWINSPHLVNRRVLSSVTLCRGKLNDPEHNVLEKILSIPVNELVQLHLSDIFPTMKSLSDEIDPFNDGGGTYVVMRKLFPRNDDNFSTTVDFFILDKTQRTVSWVSTRLNSEKRPLGFHGPCRISFNLKTIKICVRKELTKSSEEGNIHWLTDKLFPKLINWMKSNHQKNSLITGSLNLVAQEKYINLYHNLKKKYGPELVAKWSESTDPKKFVYEDIAIASYLISLWEDERRQNKLEEKQSFLDLGCGNGLLVHILTREGYSGIGIDLRKRKTWGLFPECKLEEKTIIPSSKSLFPSTDWLIGNHSDELTPWIPVIAARSSYACKFFLLPCCAYEFDGRKFQRDSTSGSQYSEYLKYIKTVCERSGFITLVDKLRIPSTKRICFVGLKRNYSEMEADSQDLEITEMINARSLHPKKFAITEIKEDNPKKMSDEWATDFKPRDIAERVRNCTQIDPNVINSIVHSISMELLRKTRKIAVNNSNIMWNAGGKIELSQLAKLVPLESLKKLKNECGGLQTLLRNHGHIFQMTGGAVRFRVPGSPLNSKRKKSGKSKIVVKVKPCWFFLNHPDGCPLPDEICNFKHFKE